MRRLRLDFQRRPLRWPLPGIVLLGCSLLALTIAAGTWRELLQRIEHAEGQVQEGRRRAQNRPLDGGGGERPARDLLPQVKVANEVLQRLQWPWDELLETLGSTGGSRRVALLSLEPDPEKNAVRLSAEAKDVNAMLAYVRWLEQQEMLEQAFLQNHQVQRQDPQQPVRFAVLGSWRMRR
jgi:hypothetical protein